MESLLTILRISALLAVASAESSQPPRSSSLRRLRRSAGNQPPSTIVRQQQRILSDEHARPTSLDEIAFSTEIKVLAIWEITEMFQEHKYVGFLHFMENKELGARGILTTMCDDDFGRPGAIFCEDGIDKCVSFEFLREPTESGRAGYCHDFLPLQEDLRADIAATHPAFALALFETCNGKNEDCL